MKLKKTQTAETVAMPKLALAEDPRPQVDPRWDLFRDGVTQGLLSQFLDCPVRAQMAYVDRLSMPRTGGALAFGSLVHELLDRVYTNHQAREDSHTLEPKRFEWLPAFLEREIKFLFERDLQRMRDFPDPHTTVQEMSDNYGMAGVVLRHYFDRWVSDFSQFNWLALERTFNVPYPTKARLGLNLPDIPIRGKRDGDIQIGKELHLFETKTKGRIEEENILDPLVFNLQVNLYLWAMKRDYGRTPRGVIYNIIRRPQLRQGKAESELEFLKRIDDDMRLRRDFYFIRYSCAILPEEQKAWELELDAVMMRVIRWAQGTDRAYRNPSACTGRFGTCTYLPICGRGERERYTQRPRIYPELEEVSENA